MPYESIVAAVDESGAGRYVAASAMALAAATGARLSLLTSVPSGAGAAARAAAAEAMLAGIERTLRADATMAVPVARFVVQGIPGIEVTRHAEERGADLIVVGHTPRSQSARLLVGDTADSVIRRSRVPCLLLPPDGDLAGPVLIAVDGTRHSRMVLNAGCQLAVALEQPVRAVTVERRRDDEPGGLVPAVLLARSVKLEDEVAAASNRCGLAVPLDIRQGDVVEQVLEACRATAAEILTLGVPRGGPAGVMEGGSVGRRLVHESPTAVLTVPL